MNRLDGDDCGMMNLRTEVQCKLLVLLVNCYSKGQGSFSLTMKPGYSLVQLNAQILVRQG